MCTNLYLLSHLSYASLLTITAEVSLLITAEVNLLITAEVSLLITAEVNLLITAEVNLLITADVNLLITAEVSLLITAGVNLLITADVNLLITAEVNLLITAEVNLLITAEVNLLITAEVNLLITAEVCLPMYYHSRGPFVYLLSQLRSVCLLTITVEVRFIPRSVPSTSYVFFRVSILKAVAMLARIIHDSPVRVMCIGAVQCQPGWVGVWNRIRGETVNS